MYETYWKLDARPFDSGGDSRFYYPSEVHQGALLKLRYAVENRRGAALLAGASGTGKTMLVEGLLRQLPETYAPRLHLVMPQMSPAELLAWVAAEFGDTAATAEGRGVDQSVRYIDRSLQEIAARGEHPVVVIDEAQLIEGRKSLETIRLLLNFTADSQPALTLVLVGQTRLLPALERMPQLEERLAVKTLLRFFTEEETHGYVSHRLSAAGAQTPIFNAAALDAVYRLTHGNPRQINRLCDLALLIGFAEEQSELGADQIEAVSRELVEVAPE